MDIPQRRRKILCSIKLDGHTPTSKEGGHATKPEQDASFLFLYDTSTTVATPRFGEIDCGWLTERDLHTTILCWMHIEHDIVSWASRWGSMEIVNLSR